MALLIAAALLGPVTAADADKPSAKPDPAGASAHAAGNGNGGGNGRAAEAPRGGPPARAVDPPSEAGKGGGGNQQGNGGGHGNGSGTGGGQAKGGEAKGGEAAGGGSDGGEGKGGGQSNGGGDRGHSEPSGAANGGNEGGSSASPRGSGSGHGHGHGSSDAGAARGSGAARGGGSAPAGLPANGPRNGASPGTVLPHRSPGTVGQDGASAGGPPAGHAAAPNALFRAFVTSEPRSVLAAAVEAGMTEAPPLVPIPDLSQQRAEPGPGKPASATLGPRRRPEGAPSLPFSGFSVLALLLSGAAAMVSGRRLHSLTQPPAAPEPAPAAEEPVTAAPAEHRHRGKVIVTAAIIAVAAVALERRARLA